MVPTQVQTTVLSWVVAPYVVAQVGCEPLPVMPPVMQTCALPFESLIAVKVEPWEVHARHARFADQSPLPRLNQLRSPSDVGEPEVAAFGPNGDVAVAPEVPPLEVCQ